MKKSLISLKTYVRHYLNYRPAFFSFIRPQEGYLFRKYEKYLKGPSLDFGCGDGFFAEMVFGKNAIDIGLDLKVSRIEQAREKNIYKQAISYEDGQIPYNDQSVSTVISNCVFEHLPKLKQNVAEISRILKPGGYLMTTVMTDKWNAYLLGKHLFGTSYIKKIEQQQDHRNLLTRESWESLLKKEHLKPIIVLGYLDKTTSRLLELSHLFSVPSLISYALFRKWVLFQHWHRPFYLENIISKRIAKSLSVNPDESAALFIVAQKV